MTKHSFEPRHDRREPCAQCPYRLDAPLGKWHPDHFIDLLQSERSETGPVYLCHNQDGNVCVGWALDQRRRGYPSVVFRLAMWRDRRLADQVEGATDGGNATFPSVTAMCIANLTRGRRKKRRPAKPRPLKRAAHGA